MSVNSFCGINKDPCKEVKGDQKGVKDTEEQTGVLNNFTGSWMAMNGTTIGEAQLAGLSSRKVPHMVFRDGRWIGKAVEPHARIELDV